MYIKLKVLTDRKEEQVTCVSSDEYHLSIKEKAENNRANHRVLEIMRTFYPNTSIKIVSGHHSPSKIISVNTP
jgi:uncharacterized protein YggU (UPF0235/DUF167 family)